MKPSRLRFAVALLLAAPFALSALEETPAQRLQMATNQIQRVAAGITSECLENVQTLGDWTERRGKLRRQLLYMLGLDPLPGRGPLNAEITGRIDRGKYRVERLVFQSLPGLYVTANFYMPTGLSKPSAAVLYLCGHSPSPQGNKVSMQNDGPIWFALNGYPCLVLDTLEFGEVRGLHHGTHNLNQWYWLSLGYTPAGVEVWNAMRALDYLETRPEVDSKRVGVTGISGGGAVTWYTAAADERVAAAVPVCSTFTIGSQSGHWLASGQCDCIYYHNTYLWDFPTVAALIAPRPLLILSGRRDSIFPPDGYHAVYHRAKRVFDLYPGVGPERIREMDDDVPHSNPSQFHREARQWLQRWLKGDTTPLAIDEPEIPADGGAGLACLSNLPPDAINYKIQRQFTAPAAIPRVSSPAAWEERRGELITQLKDKVFRWFPEREMPFETKNLGTRGGWGALYAESRDFSFQTERGARIKAQLFLPRHGATNAPLVIYSKREGDSIYGSDYDEISPLLGRCAVLILSPRFTEENLTATARTDIERTAAWVGRTMAAMQVWDILRAMDWARREQRISAPAILLYGKGDMGILSLYAALFEPNVSGVILTDPPSSHWQSPALLNVLRVTDIVEVAGALAPRKLVWLTPPPKEFDLTRTIYKTRGVPERFARAGSLPEAVEIWKY